jgi:hypothetical protein
MVNRKGTKNGLQNTAQKTIDRAIRTPLKTGGVIIYIFVVLIYVS